MSAEQRGEGEGAPTPEEASPSIQPPPTTPKSPHTPRTPRSRGKTEEDETGEQWAERREEEKRQHGHAEQGARLQDAEDEKVEGDVLHREKKIEPGRPASPYPSVAKKMLESIEPDPLNREDSKVVKKYPSYVVRMANVSSERSRGKPPAGHTKSNFYDLQNVRKQKVIRWDEAHNSRPPLPADLDGPGPWSYTPRNRPLQETNPPAWTMGAKVDPEKEGGSRTAWVKAWMHSNDAYSMKTDFLREQKWPAPTTYKKRSTLGPKQRTLAEYPAHSLGIRRNFSMSKRGAASEPSPNAYNRETGDKVMMRSFPAFSVGARRGGTSLWPVTDQTPGPAYYTPRTAPTKTAFPAISIVGIRRPATHGLGPYAAL